MKPNHEATREQIYVDRRTGQEHPVRVGDEFNINGFYKETRHSSRWQVSAILGCDLIASATINLPTECIRCKLIKGTGFPYVNGDQIKFKVYKLGDQEDFCGDSVAHFIHESQRQDVLPR